MAMSLLRASFALQQAFPIQDRQFGGLNLADGPLPAYISATMEKRRTGAKPY
jgi:hypothetical protein